jgi:hypothetical protein
MADATTLLSESALADPAWAATVKAAMPATLVADEEFDEERDEDQARQDLEALCESVLADPRAIAHPDWGGLVRAVVALSADYRELTEDAYGEALDPDEAADDEGGVVDMITDLGLSTIGLAFRLLAHPAAVKRADWADLLRHVLEEKRQRFGTGMFLSEGWEECDALFESDAVRQHPEARALRTLAGEILPLEGEPI